MSFKNKDTPENAAYWAFVEATAERVRAERPEWARITLGCPKCTTPGECQQYGTSCQALTVPPVDLKDTFALLSAKFGRIERALQAAYSGSAEHGSFHRSGVQGEYTPSVFMLIDEFRSELRQLAVSRSRAPQALPYDFEAEARRVCEAIGSDVGHMTVTCALHEAYEAGKLAAPVKTWEDTFNAEEASIVTSPPAPEEEKP